jgi:hypothetical protein
MRPIVVCLALALLGLPACHKPKNDQADDKLATGDSTTSTSAGQNQRQTSTTTKSGTTTTGRSQTSTTAKNNTATSTTSKPSTADPTAKAGVGAYARSVLRPQPATRLTLEVFQQPDAHPLPHSLDHAVSVLQQVTGKPVAVSGPIDIPASSSNVTADQIKAWADRYTQTTQSTSSAVIHLLYLNGAYQGDKSVLGISVRGDTAAVMWDQVKSASRPLPRNTIEDAVTEHEVGHLLGLVDLVLNTGRDDPEHPGHSKNTKSVMYWAVESDLVSQVLGGPPPVDFDDADRADLATIRNGG